MDNFIDSLLTAFCGSKEKVEVEVILPYGLTGMDMYKIFKDAAEQAGAQLTSFEVKKEGA